MAFRIFQFVLEPRKNPCEEWRSQYLSNAMSVSRRDFKAFWSVEVLITPTLDICFRQIIFSILLQVKDFITSQLCIQVLIDMILLLKFLES